MYKKYQTAVFIGRFQPFHNGHARVIYRGLEIAKEVVIVVGSAFAPPSLRNPFTFEQRKAMIKAQFPTCKVKVVPVMDYPYNDTKWLTAVKSAVMTGMSYTPDPTSIALIGYSKDETSYYLKMFPTWSSEEVNPWENGGTLLNATDIRTHVLSNAWDTEYLESVMPSEALEVMDEIMYELEPIPGDPEDYFLTETGAELCAEYSMINQYKSQFDAMPYPPTFMTVDAVVTQSDKILLVKRGASPGKGLWALPGGFLDQNETTLSGAIRELREETKLKVPEKVLRGSIKAQNLFDDPHRSSRGRTLTQAFHFDLGFDERLPKVKGSDDAVDARWVDIDQVDSRLMFEDHYGIIDYFLNIA